MKIYGFTCEHTNLKNGLIIYFIPFHWSPKYLPEKKCIISYQPFSVKILHWLIFEVRNNCLLGAEEMGPLIFNKGEGVTKETISIRYLPA